ncbi:hypothetical protein SDC9_192248 [bioreactor metagenome]|uniref:Uncharacterized protein n=1 Tax=bioreactor metagenome TaxID=1076179 RepID=A0A645IB90_9ZZZZ
MSRTCSVDERIGTLFQRNHTFGFALRIERDGFSALVIGGDQRRRDFLFMDFHLPDVETFLLFRKADNRLIVSSCESMAQIVSDECAFSAAGFSAPHPD